MSDHDKGCSCNECHYLHKHPQLRRGAVYVCRFDSAEHLTGRKRTYEAVKAAVLEAGRFSAFEATASNKNAALFTRLCRDPEIETFDMGFPWTGVRRKEAP